MQAEYDSDFSSNEDSLFSLHNGTLTNTQINQSEDDFISISSEQSDSTFDINNKNTSVFKDEDRIDSYYSEDSAEKKDNNPYKKITITAHVELRGMQDNWR